jgi:hypothetical protein
MGWRLLAAAGGDLAMFVRDCAGLESRCQELVAQCSAVGSHGAGQSARAVPVCSRQLVMVGSFGIIFGSFPTEIVCNTLMIRRSGRCCNGCRNVVRWRSHRCAADQDAQTDSRKDEFRTHDFSPLRCINWRSRAGGRYVGARPIPSYYHEMLKGLMQIKSS